MVLDLLKDLCFYIALILELYLRDWQAQVWERYAVR